MITFRFIKIFIILLLVKFPVTAQQCSIIPLPNSVKPIEGNFVLNNNSAIFFNQPILQKQANYLQQSLLKTNKLTVSMASNNDTQVIELRIDSKFKGANLASYSLNIKSSGIKITAATEEGVFYGITSLLQLVRLGETKANSIRISCWDIKDEPQYTWRGLMLDESRHFWGKETVKELLDWMAFYKLNKFHWHLTDEPAWRLEIKAYPMLSSIGGIGNFFDKTAPAKYYTQEEIKEIVSYAAERFIDVIPEIDMPGHATAANKAYPAFSGGGSPKHPEFTFDPGKEITYDYLSKILKEADVLFPSQMIHIGGDEVSYGNEKWNSNSGIKELMQKNNLADLLAVENYFTERMADTLFKLNNKVLLWDEAADSNLPKNKTIIFWWRQNKPEQFKKALDKGYQVVICPRLPFYFDFVQDSQQRIGRRWGNDEYVTLDKIYNFTTASLSLTNEQQNHILGIQANIWSEQIRTNDKLEYMLFPRITALAEAVWSGDKQRDLAKFKDRVQGHLTIYQKDRIYYYDPFNPLQTPEPLTPEQRTNLKIQD